MTINKFFNLATACKNENFCNSNKCSDWLPKLTPSKGNELLKLENQMQKNDECYGYRDEKHSKVNTIPVDNFCMYDLEWTNDPASP